MWLLMNECKIVQLFIRSRDLVIFVILDRSHRMHLFLSRTALLHHAICLRCSRTAWLHHKIYLRCSRIAWLRHTIYLRCSRIAWLRHLCKFIYDAPGSIGSPYHIHVSKLLQNRLASPYHYNVSPLLQYRTAWSVFISKVFFVEINIVSGIKLVWKGNIDITH